MTPVLLAVKVPFPGGQLVTCDCCPNQVIEHPANIKLVREQNGFIVCVVCALELKMTYPDIFPELGGQLWEGRVRDPEIHANWKSLIDLLTTKP